MIVHVIRFSTSFSASFLLPFELSLAMWPRLNAMQKSVDDCFSCLEENVSDVFDRLLWHEYASNAISLSC